MPINEYSNPQAVVIVGAGVCGLTLAHKLLEAKIPNPVILVEKESRAGGLARSFRYGDFIFDVGPHRFHSEDKGVMRYIEEILGSDAMEIGRSSGVWMFNRYHDWPLRPNSLFKLPFPVMLGGGRDLLFRPKAKTESFKDYVIERYGRTLYEIFFQPYTEKFLKYNCEDLHRDWAATGINRAVIDKRVKAGNLLEVLRTTLLPHPVQSKFLYPKSGGNGVFCEKLKARVERLGGTFLFSSTIEQVGVEGDHITGVRASNGQSFNAKYLFWTGPIPELIRLIVPDEPVPQMEYMSTVLANYLIDAPPQVPYQWCYFGTPDSPVQRVSIPVRFNPTLAPAGKSGLCVELTCMEGDAIWERPKRLDALIEGFLMKSGMVRRYNDILDVRFERIPNSYPLYTLNYRRKLAANIAVIRRFRNLLNFGRTGGFWYNNQDHTIRQAMEVAAAYLKDLGSSDLHAVEYARTLE